MDQLLRERTNGATLREAVEFFLVHHERKRFVATSASKCIEAFKAEEKARNLSPAQLQILTKHLGRFLKDFGTREIHTFRHGDFRMAGGAAQCGWESAERKRGAMFAVRWLALSLYSQRILNAIPDIGLTEFQKVKNPKVDAEASRDLQTEGSPQVARDRFASQRLLHTAFARQAPLPHWRR
ncbi:MAG TPA: hypothetical protein VF614_18290 [Chthoniobacteraceae bacterium]|jgi:hypothetical protein